jgi:hypothetical protein
MLNAQFMVKESPNKSIKKRQERSDKVKDLKFPVSPEQRAELRRLAKVAKNETESNTRILIAALQKYRHDPDSFPPLQYQDTGVYMHAKPIKFYWDQVEDLFIALDEGSRRSMAYRLIMNYIGKGVLLHASSSK